MLPLERDAANQTTLTSADDLSSETHFRRYAKPTSTHCECANMPACVVLAEGGQVTSNFMSYWRHLAMTDSTTWGSRLLEQADKDVGGGVEHLAGLFTRHESWKILVRCVNTAGCVPGQFQACSACAEDRTSSPAFGGNVLAPGLFPRAHPVA